MAKVRQGDVEAGFAAVGVDSGLVNLLQSGASGGNGVYAYGAASSFPVNTFNSTNYWVDVVFADSLAPSKTRLESLVMVGVVGSEVGVLPTGSIIHMPNT